MSNIPSASAGLRTSYSMARVEAMATQVLLRDQLDRRAGQLSHGQKQWLEIGMLLMQEPQLLLLDEPVAHLDHATAVAVIADLTRTSTDRTVVMVSHRSDGLDGFDRVVDMTELQEPRPPG